MDDLIVDGFSEINIELEFEGVKNDRKTDADTVREHGFCDSNNNCKCIDRKRDCKSNETKTDQQQTEFEEISFE